MTARIQTSTKPGKLVTNIAFGPNSENGGEVLGVRTALLELDLGVMLDGVRVGEHPPPSDHEAATAGAVLPLPLPRQREIRLRVHAEHLHHRVHRGDHPRRQPLRGHRPHCNVDEVPVVECARGKPPRDRGQQGRRLVGLGPLLRAAEALGGDVDGSRSGGLVDELYVADGEDIIQCGGGSGRKI